MLPSGKDTSGVSPTLLMLVVVLAASGLVPARGAAQKQTGTINNHFTADESIKGRPVMVSAIRDGEVVEQQEMQLPRDGRIGNNLTEGVYDIRVEGDGVVTEVKKGVHVFAGRELNLSHAMHAGKGAHIIEYATGGLSREEVAARLAKLDEQVAELMKARKEK
jgi:hypothetical protein